MSSLRIPFKEQLSFVCVILPVYNCPRLSNADTRHWRQSWNATSKSSSSSDNSSIKAAAGRFVDTISLRRSSSGSMILLQMSLYALRNPRLIRDGEPRTATSTFTQLLSSREYDGKCMPWCLMPCKPRASYPGENSQRRL